MKLYRTRTQEEYDWLMKELETVGYKWNSGEYATESKVKDENKGNVVVYVESGEPLTFDYVKDVEPENLKTIIEVSEMMGKRPKSDFRLSDEERKALREKHAVDSIEPYRTKTDDQVMRDVIKGRNSKPSSQVKLDNSKADDPIQPTHYRKGEIDLFESWYRTYPFNEFRAIMQSIAERYMKRDKENRVVDLEKAIYTLQRLKEYEELEE